MESENKTKKWKDITSTIKDIKSVFKKEDIFSLKKVDFFKFAFVNEPLNEKMDSFSRFVQSNERFCSNCNDLKILGRKYFDENLNFVAHFDKFLSLLCNFINGAPAFYALSAFRIADIVPADIDCGDIMSLCNCFEYALFCLIKFLKSTVFKSEDEIIIGANLSKFEKFDKHKFLTYRKFLLNRASSGKVEVEKRLSLLKKLIRTFEILSRDKFNDLAETVEELQKSAEDISDCYLTANWSEIDLAFYNELAALTSFESLDYRKLMSTSETYSFLIENIKSVRDILSVDNFSNVYEANHFFDSIAYLKLPILSRAILSKRINSQHFYGQIESNWIFTNKNPLLDKNYIEISKSIFDEYFNNLARNESYRLNFLVDNKILENLEWTANFSKNEKMSTSLWFYEQSLNARTHFLFLGFNLNLYEEKEHAAVFWLLSKMQKMRCDALKKYLIKLSENGNSKNGSEILKKSLQNVLITCESQQAISSSTLLLLLLSKGDKLKFGFQTIFSNGKKRFEGRFKHVLKGLSAENDFDHFSNEIDLINKRQKENKEDFILKIGQEMVEIRRKMKSIEKNGFNNRWIGQILEVVEHNLDILKYFDGSKIDIAFENGVFLPKIEIEAILE